MLSVRWLAIHAYARNIGDVNRTDLQTLADVRVDDAKVLLAAGRFTAAYYLIGYAIEFALKACIAKQIKEHDFPDKRLILDSYTHDLSQLLRLSGVKPLFDAKANTDKAFEVNWTTVKDWGESARYDATRSELEARDLFAAITDTTTGILPWIKTVW